MKKDSAFLTIKTFLLSITTFLFPLFFLPITQEYFITNKFYLLTVIAILLIIISIVELIVKSDFRWKKTAFEMFLLLFTLAVAVSTFLAPNPRQSLMNPYLNLISLLSLIIIFLHYLRTDSYKTIVVPLACSSLIISLISLPILLLHPLASGQSLSDSLMFLKNPRFTPLGNQLDLGIFLGFSIVLTGCELFILKGEEEQSISRWLFIGNIIVGSITLTTVVFFLIKDNFFLSLPTYKLSWYTALETLKKPAQAIFGIGIDNFSTAFTKAKDSLYNQTSQWQVPTYSGARTVLLHIFTETGLFGLVTFLLLLGTALKKTLTDQNDQSRYFFPTVLFMILVIVFCPPSLIVFFLLFLSVGLIYQTIYQEKHASETIDTKNIRILILIVGAVLFVGLLGASYFLGKNYLADYHMRKSVEGILRNDVRILYDNQRQAVLLNPYEESYRVAFSQTNILLANNLSRKSASGGAQLTQQDKQVTLQAIEAAIEEAKSAISLNPFKAVYWDNLASIYRNILQVAQGADVWTLSSYQRAITLDPNNPLYRLNLGAVYFSLKNYDAASTLFEQAVALKPDWPNARYNLAWTFFQKKDFGKAVSAMQQTIKLIDPEKDKTDYDKAVKDLEKFIAASKGETPEANQLQENTQNTVASQEGKIKLPETSSPNTLPTLNPSIKLTPVSAH